MLAAGRAVIRQGQEAGLQSAGSVPTAPLLRMANDTLSGGGTEKSSWENKVIVLWLGQGDCHNHSGVCYPNGLCAIGASPFAKGVGV